MTAQATLCPSCRRETRTIRGICPHCGHAKEGRPALHHRKIASGDFWGDLDDLFFSLMVAPGLALLIVALVFVVSDLLLLAAIALLIAPFVARLVSD
jgi:predicted amidophosphoribosyltransferase